MFVIPAVALAQVEMRIILLIGSQAYTSEIGVLADPHSDVALSERREAKGAPEDLPARLNH